MSGHQQRILKDAQQLANCLKTVLLSLVGLHVSYPLSKNPIVTVGVDVYMTLAVSDLVIL